MSDLKCTSCGCACTAEEVTVDTTTNVVDDTSSQNYHSETQFAVLLALVPAMTMSLFNMMGLI